MKKTWTCISAAVISMAIANAYGADDKAAQSLMKKSGCGNCHSLDKKKVGPTYKETSAKYKGAADAEAKLVTHLTTNPMVTVDGKEEAHKSLKTTSESDVRNVVQWILSK